MKRSPLQDKAIAWFAEQNGLKPQMSAHPVYYFVDENGVEQHHNILNLVAQFERWRVENKRSERKRGA